MGLDKCLTNHIWKLKVDTTYLLKKKKKVNTGRENYLIILDYK